MRQKAQKFLMLAQEQGGIIPFVPDAIGEEGLIEAIDYAGGMVKSARQKFLNEKRVRFSIIVMQCFFC